MRKVDLAKIRHKVDLALRKQRRTEGSSNTVKADAMPSDKKHLGLGDSFGLLSLLATLTPMVITVPISLKVVFLIATACGLVVFAHQSQWTYSLSRSKRWSIALIAAIALMSRGVIELIEDWNFPKVVGVVYGLKINKGNANGCVAYLVEIPIPADLDHLSCRIIFPMNVVGYKVGTAQEFVDASMAVNEIGATFDGECNLAQAAVVNNPQITGILAGPGIIRVTGRDVAAESGACE